MEDQNQAGTPAQEPQAPVQTPETGESAPQEAAPAAPAEGGSDAQPSTDAPSQ